MFHSDPLIETWDALNHEWLPVKDYCQRRMHDCLLRLAARDKTQDIIQVRTIQAEIDVLNEMAVLPELQLQICGKSARKAKETIPHGR
jgi:hypothetical protein